MPPLVVVHIINHLAPSVAREDAASRRGHVKQIEGAEVRERMARLRAPPPTTPHSRLQKEEHVRLTPIHLSLLCPSAAGIQDVEVCLFAILRYREGHFTDPRKLQTHALAHRRLIDLDGARDLN
eukprot:2986665-Rhodomonas_salina.2